LTIVNGSVQFAPILDLAHIVVGKNGAAVIELALAVPVIRSKWQMQVGTRVAR
jgi:hypothetical protein